MPPSPSKRKYRKTAPAQTAQDATSTNGAPNPAPGGSVQTTESWERHYHGAPGTGEVAAVSMFGAEDPDLPNVYPWKEFCNMGGTEESPKTLAIAAMYETRYEGAYTEFWNEYTQLLHDYAGGKKYIVVITMQSGYIGFVQQAEVKFIDKCRGGDVISEVSSTRNLKKTGSLRDLKIPRPDFRNSYKMAMTFVQFQTWAQKDFAPGALGNGDIPALEQAQANFKRLLDRERLVRQAELWERGVTEIESADARCMLRPDGRFRTIWDVVQLPMLAYVALVIPFRASFGVDMEVFSAKWWIELIVDVYFIVDVVLNFRTGIVLPDTGRISLKPKHVARNYCCSWCLLDVASCLPVNYIAQAWDSSGDHQSSNLKLLKIARVIRIAKVFRVARLARLLSRHAEFFEEWIGLVRTLGLMISVFVCVHFIGCGWYAVGVGEQLEEGQLSGWVSRQTLDVWNSTGDRTTIDTMTRYIAATYWAAAMLSVGSSITPETNIERVYAACIAVVCCLVFAALVTMIGTTIAEKQVLDRKVPTRLGRKIKRFMRSMYTAKAGFDEGKLLTMLPPNMAAELRYHLYKAFIVEVPIFSNIAEAAVNSYRLPSFVCFLVVTHRQLRGETVYNRGEIGRELYVVVTGEVRISITHLTDDRTQKAGQTFGDDCLCDLFEDYVLVAKDPYRRRDTATVTDDCELRFWTLVDLREICENFPSLRSELWILHSFFKSKRQRAIAASWRDKPDAGVSDSTVEIAERMKLKLLGSERNTGRAGVLPPLPNAPPSPGGEVATGDAGMDARVEKAQNERRLRELERHISSKVGIEIDKVTARLDQQTAKIDQLAKTLTAVAESLNVNPSYQPDPAPAASSGGDEQAENEARPRLPPRTRSRRQP